MNNYEKITAIIKSWHLAVCKLETWWTIIYSFIMSDWCIRRSWYNYGIDSLWTTYDSKKEINNCTFISITPLNTFKPLSKGDKVMIMENARECATNQYWGNSTKEMIWKWPFEIYNIWGSEYAILNKKTNDCHSFPFHTVCLWLWEDKPIETIEIGGLKYSKEEVENALKGLKSLS
jgi:ferredoxin-like protein FixX